MRLLWLSLLIAVILALPFLFWGETFEIWFAGESAVARLRGCGAWAWAAIVGLLAADLVLPLPGTAVMSAGGFIYGALLGGVIAAGGSFLSGLLAYGLCRRFGHGIAERLAGREELARGEALFSTRGAWLVALSRALPLLPEVVACLAGLTRMPLRTFTISLACGCVPVGFIFAGIGAAGQSRPGLAFALSIAVPAVFYALAQPWLRRHPPRVG